MENKKPRLHSCPHNLNDLTQGLSIESFQCFQQGWERRHAIINVFITELVITRSLFLIFLTATFHFKHPHTHSAHYYHHHLVHHHLWSWMLLWLYTFLKSFKNPVNEWIVWCVNCVWVKLFKIHTYVYMCVYMYIYVLIKPRKTGNAL